MIEPDVDSLKRKLKSKGLKARRRSVLLQSDAGAKVET